MTLSTNQKWSQRSRKETEESDSPESTPAELVLVKANHIQPCPTGQDLHWNEKWLHEEWTFLHYVNDVCIPPLLNVSENICCVALNQETTRACRSNNLDNQDVAHFFSVGKTGKEHPGT